MSETSPRRIGRVLALISLTLIVSGVIAQGLISNRLIVFADAAATARNIVANIGLFRLGFTIFLVEMVAQVATTALWYSLLRPVNRAIALNAAFIDLAGGVMKTFARVFYIVPVWILAPPTGTSPLHGFTPEQLESISLVLLNINNRGAAAALAFFGFSGVLRGYLIYRSTFMPPWLGVLAMISGAMWLSFLYPPLGSLMFMFAAMLALASAAIMIGWLLFRGINDEKWKAAAKSAEY
jgi:hypothetical protein